MSCTGKHGGELWATREESSRGRPQVSMCSSNACVQRTRTMSTAVRDRERARVAAGAAYDSSHARVNRRVMWAALIALPGVTVQATRTPPDWHCIPPCSFHTACLTWNSHNHRLRSLRAAREPSPHLKVQSRELYCSACYALLYRLQCTLLLMRLRLSVSVFTDCSIYF